MEQAGLEADIDTPVFLITGAPGAGKTSVSTALMKRFPYGLHIPVDDLREWVVSGLADPVPVWTDETTRQFRIARRSALQTARIYLEAGFAVAIDDVIFPHEAKEIFETPLSTFDFHKILLKPGVEAAQLRNANRTNKTFDTAGLTPLIGRIHTMMPPTVYRRAGWIVIDSTEMSLEETVDAILSNI